jgi:hypothetical protein
MILTEFSHGKETFLPLAKRTIYCKNPRTHCMNLYIVSDFLDVETKSGDLSWRCSAKG